MEEERKGKASEAVRRKASSERRLYFLYELLIN